MSDGSDWWMCTKEELEKIKMRVEEAAVDNEQAVIEPEHPEHDKLEKVSKDSQAIGQFLEWLGDREPTLVLCTMEHSSETYPEDLYWPARTPIDKLLAEYFDIDLNKIENEKRGMLKSLRDHQKGKDDLRERQRSYIKRRSHA